MSGTDEDSRAGSDFGPYRLRRLIGRGGMGEVYEAEDTVKDRIVALKLLPEKMSHDPVFRTRLQREAHSAGRLQEPHVVPIHDYGEIDGLLYVDMRLIDGIDLRSLLKQYGPMKPARAVTIIRQIASALDAAHESGVMHRDVKPENILITRDDFAYLVDFGIANAATDQHITELGTAVGTYAYMAPERFTKDEVTYRADLYALTCVLHECLTGSQPFPGDSVSVVITSHLMEPPPRPSQVRPGVPTAFDAVIARGMAKKPADRYASAGEMAAAAEAALADRATTVLPRPAVPAAPVFAPQYVAPTPPPVRRNRTPWVAILAAGAVVVALFGAFGIWWLAGRDASDAGSPVTATEAAEVPADSPDSRLLALLPKSYADDACKSIRPPAPGALATVDCGKSSAPGGPAAARYSLFPDLATLANHFNEAIKENSQLQRCPGSAVDSPTSWHYNATPTKAEGSIACGTYQGRPDLIWTKDSALLLADAQGPSIDDLHKWWLKYA
ncbi:serine/threonine-protein kinase [Mycobacterium hubeiense]|uniref:serine/threonine-protein kinase n=1 Tax=Mycobacterium hubeiense TaxID=1867256 RepID=UPI000C7F02F9|nr:serine/threonine-protein kinase [Mycobacterium sp. QGD 101]